MRTFGLGVGRCGSCVRPNALHSHPFMPTCVVRWVIIDTSNTQASAALILSRIASAMFGEPALPCVSLSRVMFSLSEGTMDGVDRSSLMLFSSAVCMNVRLQRLGRSDCHE